jgi:hypothetical protein
MHLSDPSGKIIYSIVPFSNYTVPGIFIPSVDPATIQELVFDPEKDLLNLNILFGDYRINYNILRPVVVKNFNPSLFIKEISGNRTEIRLSTNNISNSDIIANTNEFIRNFQSTPYFKEFYLNFGKNQLIPAINIALDLGPSSITTINNVGTSALLNGPTVLIKLLNPLPVKYKVNDLLTLVDEIANPQVFNAEIIPDTIPATFPTLRGPNFDLDLDNLRVGPTPYYNFNQITSSQATFGPLQQLLGQLSASNFAINIDYDNFEYTDWIHFSSAARRLEGFQYKLDTIEINTEASASASISTSPTAQLDAQAYQNKINSTIQSFDGWEQHLYYTSGAYSWPKQNSVKPYINYSVTASQAINWYSGSYSSSSLYDDNNQNYLLYAMPGYITENDDNELAFKFVASMGQMFDDIWIHIKAITDLYKAKNALDQGISKDLVYFALQSMGIDVYTDEDGANVFRYLYGISDDGSYLPITGSYDTLISASNYQLSGQDQQKGIYKRLYHNLPLLLKSKGTTRFIQYLNTVFGIPETIIGYLEYGGVDKVTSSFEYEYDRFAYALQVSGSNTISVPWNYTSQSAARTTYTDIAPNGIEFRFKAYPTSSFTTQSLFYSSSNIQFNVLYANTASNDSIYSGSVGDFGYFQFKLGGLSVTSSTIPVYYTGSNSDSDNDNDWFNVLVQRTNPNLRLNQTGSSQTYTFYVKNNVWGEIGHTTSASLTTATAASNSLWYSQGSITFGGGSYPFSGSLQDIRLWSNYLSESTFDSHVLNPESIEGNFYTSSFADLTARFALGSNLYIYNHSLTASVASVAPDQSIQQWTASFANFSNTVNYESFTETYYADVANSGYANPVTDKVRIISGSEYGTQLLPNKSIEIQPIIPLTKDIHILDASLSPQDEIDRAIIAQFGSTYDLDTFIGNPATGSYGGIRPLQADFFKKFVNKYNYKDYVRLISFFHNSLFRTLKDFTPGRTNLSTGIVIKPHLLERPVVLRPEPQFTYIDYSQSIDTAFISASNGGDYSQSLYPITIPGVLGNVTFTSDARDFFTGELPSSSLQVTITQSNPFTTFNVENTCSYSESIWYHNYYPLLNNVSGSRDSYRLKRIDYITSGSRLVQVLSTASIQDFTYNYQRHVRPRYFGSQTNSLEYNFFNTNDNNYWVGGVGPLGRSAAIDKNTIKFAYFNEAVSTGSQTIAMPERTNIYLKYLIDASGSLTELTQRDYVTTRNNEFWNLYQVQNIFKGTDAYQTSGSVNISLFDNQNPSQQKSLEGNKIVWASGFKFYPLSWRIANTIQNYFIPAGSSTEPIYNTSNYNLNNPRIWSTRVIVHLFWTEISIFGNVEWKSPGGVNLPFDVIVTLKIRVALGNPSYTDCLIPAKKPDGSPNISGSFRHDRGFAIVNGIDIISVRPASGVDPGFFYTANDPLSTSHLTVNSADKRIVSCSAKMTEIYNIGFFSGSSLTSNSSSIDALLKQYNTYTPTEYPFALSSGDVVRFDGEKTATTPTSFFKSENEYVVISVNSTGSPVTFTLDRAVNDAVTASTPYRIERYVFSKKMEDETNIIIIHTKKPGQTSSGIIKNVNLSLQIDDQISNIVSNLKNKIFSTVLVP